MNFLSFLKKEAVFCAAFFCAAVSAFFVPPAAVYFSYIDFDTLFILFALMAVIAALRECGVFDTMARFLCSRIHSVKMLCTVLTSLCFFTSMFIANDVALLTFVPFTLALLVHCAKGSTVLFTVVLETVAANTGSMLTPLGNPQNLFLFSKLNCSVSDFSAVILPYSAVCFILIFACIFFMKEKGRTGLAVRKLPEKEEETVSLPEDKDAAAKKEPSKKVRIAVYSLLFVFCILCVVRIFPKWSAALSAFLVLLILNRKVLLKVDYMLLLTFTAFFIFTGNISSLPSVHAFLESFVKNNEFFAGVVSSQVISNVPAALLLYPFSSDVKSLLLGVNAGGLGTLIASLASLISFKLYSAPAKKLGLPSSSRYLLVFTAVNAAFLLILCIFYYIQ